MLGGDDVAIGGGLNDGGWVCREGLGVHKTCGSERDVDICETAPEWTGSVDERGAWDSGGVVGCRGEGVRVTLQSQKGLRVR